MGILEGLVDEKLLCVLRLFLSNPEGLYHITKVSADSKVPMATSFRLVHALAGQGLIESTSIGKTKLYRLASSERAKALRRLL